MLQKEKFLLLLNLATQFFLRWHICKVLGSKELVIVVQYGIAGYVFIRFSTKQEPNGWVVSFLSHHLIVHSHIHIHLSNVLMTKF